MKTRPNFYILLDIDPSVSDWETINAAIKDKRRTWSMEKNQGSPAARRKAEKNMTFLREMESLLKDTEGRKQQAIEARKEKDKERRERIDELIDFIKIMSSTTDTVLHRDVKILVNKTGKLFTEGEVEKYLKKYGITVGSESGKRKSKSRPKLEQSIAKGIRGELDSLNLKSLYDFLNFDHTPRLNVRSSPKSLFDRADSIYRELNRLGKTDSDSTTKMSLAGRSKSVFKTASEKERYDNTMAIDALSELEKPLEIAGRNKFIETAVLDELIIKAKKIGVTEDLAVEYIEDYVARRKWGIQKGKAAPKAQLRLCGFCDTLADTPIDERCKNCGEEFIQPCPLCGGPTPTENAACMNCGCSVGDAPLVKNLFRIANDAVSKGDLAKASDYLNRALEYWPGWEPAIVKKSEIDAIKKERSESLQKVFSLITNKKLTAAEAQLETHKLRLGYEGTAKAQQLIREGLKRSQDSCDEADKLNKLGKEDEALDKYEEALSYCADFQVAQTAIKNNPPSPPENVNVRWVGQTMRLSWDRSKRHGKISYRVIRKNGSLPMNVTDGRLIAETSSSEADDNQVDIGQPYYYGIFSVRAGIISPLSVKSGPHIRLGEAKDIQYEVGSQQISISWKLQNGSIGVEIWRREGLAPDKPLQGTKINFSGQNLIDTGLKNGRRYGYLIISKFRDPSGKAQFIFSKGKSIHATPASPPKPVLDLSVQLKNHIAFLTWTVPKGSPEIQIRQTQSIPEIEPGLIISASKADKYGAVVPSTSNGTGQTGIRSQGRIYFIPLSIVSETAVAGKPVSITTIDEISNLTSYKNGRNIVLSWLWPEGATEVLLCHSNKSYPTVPSINNSTKVRITRSEYDRQGFWELHAATNQKYYFTVFVCDPSADIYSNGIRVLEAMGTESTVQYRIKTKRTLLTRKLKNAWLEFTSKEDIILNHIVAVLKKNFPPVSKYDGTEIYEAKELHVENGKATLMIPDKYINSKGYIKVFFKRDSGNEGVRLMPFSKEKLLLQ